MKTAAFAFALCSLSVPAGVARGSAAGPAPTPAVNRAPKPYTLFVATDVDLWIDNAFCRVDGVAGSSFLVTDRGRRMRVPMSHRSYKIRIRGSLQLRDTSATVTDLKAERAYTPGADPVRRWAAQGTGGGDTGAAASQYLGAQRAYNQNLSQVNDPTLRPEIRAGLAQMTPALRDAANQTASNLTQSAYDNNASDEFNPGYNAMQMQEALDKKQFDAIDVNFAVSSPRPLTDPYVVVLVPFHDPKEAKGTSHNWIYAEALGPINERTRRIHIKRGGFPPGFEMGKYAVHLYDHGREVATNVAEGCMKLSRDEAFNYMVIDYVAGHKDSTLAPTLAMGGLSADERAALSPGELARELFVRVSKDGLPQGVFLDQGCTQKVRDASAEAIVERCRFRPALAKGRPTSGVARLTLSELAR